MTAQTKYIVFKGIEKKEQILFKSFLNLSRTELEYQIVILKDRDTESPDIVILDDQHEFSDDEQALKALPTIMVGADIDDQRQGYIARPVQWSDFKTAFAELNIEQTAGSEEADERVLPSEVKFAIPEVDEPTEDILEPISKVAEAAEAEFSDQQEYELDKMSIDYHSFTNTEYGKAADDVAQYKGEEEPALDEHQIMFTDDESASVNSVLVIETNSLDAWDFSESEMTTDGNLDPADLDESGLDEAQDEVVLERKAGFELAENEQYWLEDNEIIVDHESIFFVKPARDLVYSPYEPGKWPKLIQQKSLTKLPLSDDWRPKHDVTGYPISDLQWVNTLVNDTTELVDGLDPEQEYMLERWPHFDLIQLDNVLLKLCTMLFVRGETIASLSQKSGYGLSTVRGLVNACHQADLIKKVEDMQLEQLASTSNDAGMLGKIKDVFR